jgi:hypothetical protein
MLFPYKYVPHEIEKFQKYLDFLFMEVWCKARGKFSSAKLRCNPELKRIYERLHYEDSKGAQFFNSHIEMIYEDFLKINKDKRKKLKEWYRTNNKISAVYGNRYLQPVNFDRLIKRHPVLGKHLKTFYSRLYSNESPFNLAAFGNLKEIKKRHYKKFIDANFGGHEGICPFCGLNSIKGNDHTKLEAYDHGLPQGTYPFTSINFRNLAPTCHECNSSYKLEKDPTINIDPISKSKTRRKAFYPYSKKKKWTVDVKIKLLNKDIKTLKKEEIEIELSSGNRNRHVESWAEVYGIEERYKAKLLGDHAGKKWYSDVRDGIKNARKLLNNPGLKKDDWVNYKINECNEDLLADCNFLKKPFLVECSKQNIL